MKINPIPCYRVKGSVMIVPREELVRRGIWLNYAAIGYNSLEASIA